MDLEQVAGRLQGEELAHQGVRRGRQPGLGQVGLDLLDLGLGDLGLLGLELPAVAPGEEAVRSAHGRPQVPLQGLQVAVLHGQLGQAGVFARAHDRRRRVGHAQVGGQEDVGLGLLHVVDVLAEGAASGVVDFQHLAVEGLVVSLLENLQDDRALEGLVGLGADGQELVVFREDRVADLIDAALVVDLDDLGAFAGRLEEGQLLGQLAEGEGPGRLGQLLLDDLDVAGHDLDERVVLIHVSGSFP